METTNISKRYVYGIWSFAGILMINILTCIFFYLKYLKGKYSMDVFILSVVLIEVAYFIYLLFWGLVIVVKQDAIEFKYWANILKKKETFNISQVNSIKYTPTSSRWFSSIITLNYTDNSLHTTKVFNSFIFKYEFNKFYNHHHEIVNVIVE